MTADRDGRHRDGRHDAAGRLVPARRTSTRGGASINTNDLRGKVLRIKVNADGSYTIPTGNLFKETRTATTDAAGDLRDGLPEPVPDPGRLRRRRVRDRLLARLAAPPASLRGRPAPDGLMIVRKPANYGWPMCYGPNLPIVPVGLQHSQAARSDAEQYTCDDPDAGPGEHVALEHRSMTGHQPADKRPPIAQPDVWYSYNDNANPPQGTPCLAYYDGSGGTCPQLFPELGTRAASARTVRPSTSTTRPTRATTKFPAYYDDAIFFGEFTRDYLREIRLDSQGRMFKINRLARTAAGAATTRRTVRVRQPDGHAVRGRRQLLPAHVRRRLLQSPTRTRACTGGSTSRASERRWRCSPRRRPTAWRRSTVQFSSDGSSDPDPNDSITFEWDFDGNGTVDSMDPNPVHTLHRPTASTPRG